LLNSLRLFPHPFNFTCFRLPENPATPPPPQEASPYLAFARISSRRVTAQSSGNKWHRLLRRFFTYFSIDSICPWLPCDMASRPY
jgi:hypothetical protein